MAGPNVADRTAVAVRRRADHALRSPATWITVLAGIALVVFTVVLRTRQGGGHGVLLVDDLGQLIAAVSAAIAATWACTRSAGRMRWSWLAVAVAAGGWAAGQAVWCYYELLGHRPTPFPSAADAGYLVFPIAGALGMWLFPSDDSHAARRRWAVDGAIIVTSLVTVSWSTTLGAIAHGGGDTRFAFAVSLAYPVGDILILSMALLGLGRPSAHRRQLVLLSLAMSAMAVADSSFSYLTATGKYDTGSPADIGWVASFLFLAVAAAQSGAGSKTEPARADTDDAMNSEEPPAVDRAAARVTMLPYLPFLVATLILGVRLGQGDPIDSVEAGSVALAMAMVLLRQYFTVRENRHLLDIVAAREITLHQRAFHDQLTGLANRALFFDRVQHALDLHQRDLRPVAILFCDLDDFKAVNDSLGHGAGDALLVRVAERLQGALRPSDTLARLGGDEFAVLLEDGGEPTAVAARIVDALRASFLIAGTPITMRVSVGVTELDPTGPTLGLDDLIAQADIAMYAAKRAGKGQLALYDPAMTAAGVEDLRLREPLTQAISHRLVDVAYQPIYDLHTGRMRGLEALARWTVDGEAVSPARFVPVAARAGLLGELTDHMLDMACAQLGTWSSRLGHHRLQVGVNVPPGMITDLSFPARVARVIRHYGLMPDQLVLEITEDALLHQLPVARTVSHQLRDLGARLSLDDFGRGHSSLLHLQQIPLQSVKIDQGFVTNIDHDDRARTFTGALITLGRDIGLDVIAEGVELPAQAEVLRQLGCPLAQGYLFNRPGSAEQLDPYVFGERPDALGERSDLDRRRRVQAS